MPRNYHVGSTECNVFISLPALRGSNSENIFSGNIFSAYQLKGLVTGLESYAKAPAAIRSQNRKMVKGLKGSRVQLISDDESEVEVLPLSKRMAQQPVRIAPAPAKKAKVAAPAPCAYGASSEAGQHEGSQGGSETHQCAY